MADTQGTLETSNWSLDTNGPPRLPHVAIVWHPDTSRIGEEVPLLGVESKDGVALSRLNPCFHDRWQAETGPLSDRHISRSPLIIRQAGAGAFELTPPASRMQVAVNGAPLMERTIFGLEDLGEEILICLGGAVVLALFSGPPRRLRRIPQGLIGLSPALAESLVELERQAGLSGPLLIRGETGTGKELVAHAIHRLSGRSPAPLIAVNMSTLLPEMAVAELFGARRGAYTGADHDRKGLFEQADGGTLLLDEIGETPPQVQAMLLRTLEDGRIRRLGEQHDRPVDVRVVAATDHTLDGATGFHAALKQRLENAVVALPPLRRRRADIGLLLRHFLQSRSSAMGIGAPASLDAALVYRLALHDWPGNVRQLRNTVNDLLLSRRPEWLKTGPHGQRAAPSQANGPAESKPRSINDISEEELLVALDKNRWEITSTARALGISRPSLYDRLKQSSQIREISDLEDGEIQTALSQSGHHIEIAARQLRVLPGRLRDWIKVTGAKASTGPSAPG